MAKRPYSEQTRVKQSVIPLYALSIYPRSIISGMVYILILTKSKGLEAVIAKPVRPNTANLLANESICWVSGIDEYIKLLLYTI